MKVWCNGDVLPADAPLVRADDRGLSLGDGLFETLKIRDGRALFLTEHLCRLAVSGREMGLAVDRAALRGGLATLMDEWRAAGGAPAGSARITVTRGPMPRGLGSVDPAEQRPVSIIQLFPAGTTEAAPGPDRLVLAPFCRSAGAPSARLKTLSYGDNLRARAAAAEVGAADAVFRNEHGEVTSTTHANLWLETEAGFITPPLSSGILAGTVRELLLRHGPAAGIAVRVQRIHPDDLAGRWVHRTNSLFGVRPAWVDTGGRAAVPAGAPSKRLAALYAALETQEMAQ